MTQIRKAEAPDAEWIADLIGAEFQHLGVAAWLVPDPADRARILPRNFQIFVEYALDHGEVSATTDRSAAAVWIPRGLAELPAPENYQARVAAVCGDAAERFFQLDALFDKYHPEKPHHHLAFIAVRKDCQRTGVGSAVLRSHHQRLDRDGIPAFLEASSPGSRDLYLRHGYQLLGQAYAVPNGALFWPMWREPAAGP